MKKQDIIVLTGILLALVLVRVFFNIPNFNPLGAVALMGGVLFGKKLWAYAIPLGILFLGDVLIGRTSPMHMEYLFSTSFYFCVRIFCCHHRTGNVTSQETKFCKSSWWQFSCSHCFLLGI